MEAKIERGKAPAAGFERSAPEEKGNYLTQIAAAGKEAQNLLELVTELGSSLSLSEMLSVLKFTVSKMKFKSMALTLQCLESLFEHPS